MEETMPRCTRQPDQLRTTARMDSLNCFDEVEPVGLPDLEFTKALAELKDTMVDRGMAWKQRRDVLSAWEAKGLGCIDELRQAARLACV
jgi:hypothetical protein